MHSSHASPAVPRQKVDDIHLPPICGWCVDGNGHITLPSIPFPIPEGPYPPHLFHGCCGGDLTTNSPCSNKERMLGAWSHPPSLVFHIMVWDSHGATLHFQTFLLPLSQLLGLPIPQPLVSLLLALLLPLLPLLLLLILLGILADCELIATN